jgi:hypothetical protein
MQEPPGVLSPHPVVQTCTLWLDSCNQAVYVFSQYDVPCTNTGTTSCRAPEQDGWDLWGEFSGLTQGAAHWPQRSLH